MTRERLAGLPERDRAVLVGLAAAWLVFGALFPWFPGTPRLEEGGVAPVTLTAPRAVSYVSDVLTQQRRQEAADSVSDILVFDPAVRTRQLADLDRRLDRIDVARRDLTLSTPARESSVRAASDGALSERSAAALAAATDAQWAQVVDQSRATLARVLTGTLAPADLESTRQRIPGLLSPDLSSDQAAAVAELLAPLVVPTLVVDVERTAAQRAQAMAAQPPVRVNIEAGDVVVEAGRFLTPADIERLDQLSLRSRAMPASHVAAVAAVAVLAGCAWAGYLAVFRPLPLRGLRRFLLAALLLGLPLAATKLALPHLLPDNGRYFLVGALPLAAAPMAAAVLLDAGVGLMLALTLGLGTAGVTHYLPPENGSLAPAEGLRLAFVVVAGSVGGLLVAANANRLQRFLAAGLASGAAAGLAFFAFWALDPTRANRDLVWAGGSVLAGGLLSAILAVGAFVLLSRPFGIVTRVELMELAQLSHPLLRRLQDEAPGTFQHAILVGNLAERAADRIGADALLARVGAYYHDVGKLAAPGFFVENVHPDANPHEGLDPLQSTRVIHQHVSAGIEIGRRAGLPAAVLQFIPEHHGTRLVSYFYRRAVELDPRVDSEPFRYPGPRPRSRESALVMIADACEATVRATLDRSGDRIRAIVEGVIRERIEEGQFSECDISLRDLAIVADSFTRSLTAVYHPRVEYPAPTADELAARRVEPPPPPTGVGQRRLPPEQVPALPMPGSPPAPDVTAVRPPPVPREPLSEDDS